MDRYDHHTLIIDSAELSYGGRKILQGGWLRVSSGEAVALFGRNGSGKSSLLQMLYGTLRGTFAHVRFDDQPLERAFLRPDVVRYVPQFDFMPGFRTVRRVFQDYRIAFSGFIEWFPELERVVDARLDRLSGGERRLVELFVVIRSETRFCLLDEPFSQLMPLHVATLRKIIRQQMSEHHKGFVVADHLVREVLPLCDRICFVQNGTVTELPSAERLVDYGYKI